MQQNKVADMNSNLDLKKIFCCESIQTGDILKKKMLYFEML
jgi:hypothetical protein